MYKARYIDRNDAVNEIDLNANTDRGARAEATKRAPAMNHITLMKDGEITATRSYSFGLEGWVSFS